MKKRLAALALLAAAVTLPGTLSAATDPSLPSLKPGTFKPIYTVGPKHNSLLPPHASSGTLPQWNGSFVDHLGSTINFTQIGGNPATTNATTTITVLLIPIKMVFTQGGKTYTFDPKAQKLANNHNRNVVKAMLDSPLFQSNVDFSPQFGNCASGNQCVNLGTTQYEDAFQRGTWWGNAVGTNTNYHVVYQTVTEKEQTISVSCSNCVINNPFGSGIVGTYDINMFDGKLQTFMSGLSDVNPGVLPLFISYDVYLTEGGGCCIGGYHNANSGQPSGQTYSYATYVDTVGAFSQDVSAFSHELGEWMDDPFVDNNVNCTDNSIMEVGDPLEGLSNYGAFPYTDKHFTYNLQSLVYMPYFGAPVTDSANKWFALQDDMNRTCPGQ